MHWPLMEEQVEDGDVMYTLKLNDGKTGYENTIEPRRGQFHANPSCHD